MMKQFALKSLSAGILLGISLTAHSDTFAIEELPTAENFRHSFPQAMNGQGFVVGISRFPTDLDIDLTQVSATVLANAGISDVEQVESLTPAQYEYIVNSLAMYQNTNPQQLQLGLHNGFYFDGLTRSVDFFEGQPAITSESYLYAINSSNSAVGTTTGPFMPVDYTYTNGEDEEITSTFYVRDFISRGVWLRDGLNTRIAPPETAEMGGESAIMDVNDNGLAAGYASTAVSPFAQERLSNCVVDDPDAVVTRPKEVCYYSIWLELYNQKATNIAPSYYSRSEYLARRSIYDIRGFLWQLDNNGEVISSTKLGTLQERREDDDRDFSSYALALNNNDIAVGQSWTYHPVRGAIRMPALFQNGEALPVTTDERYFWGAATDINDNNRSVGYLVENRAGNLRNTAFYHDLDSPEPITLPGFFSGSSTVPNAINNNGVIVGTGEIEATISSVRRRVGFWYDSQAEQPSFIDLNETTACDSPYFIVEANDVTDSGEVLATALKTEEYLDANGETQTREVSVAIKLNPIEGELNNCRQEENEIERSGASFGHLPLLALAILGGLITRIRRKRF
ncbi:DUF3466 family protein [Idiomarina seosinensis]|uniref:DUF3466 family protein n=1 Tax=Idiomarina seosinensis TaxID=281739 RepID=UPI00384B546D